MVIEFLKSFIFSLKMRRYRNMSLLIAILIFVLSIYLLLIPYRIATNNMKDDLIKDNELNVLPLFELTDPNFDYSVIKDMNYVVKEGRFFSDTEKDDPLVPYRFTYSKDSKNIVVNIIFDPNDTVQDEIDVLFNSYKEMFNLGKNATAEELNKAKNIAKLYYIEKKNNNELDQETRFNELKTLSDEKFNEEMKKYTIYDLYGLTSSKDDIDVLVVFNETTMGYSSEDNKQEVIDGIITYSNDKILNISQVNSIEELGKGIADYIMKINISMMQSNQTLNFIITILLLPLILVFILWLFYRKNGSIKRYKEYYNICAMSSVVPTLFVFVVCFFWPNILTFHIFLVLIYYIYMLYRINTVQIDVD